MGRFTRGGDPTDFCHLAALLRRKTHNGTVTSRNIDPKAGECFARFEHHGPCALPLTRKRLADTREGFDPSAPLRRRLNRPLSCQPLLSRCCTYLSEGRLGVAMISLAEFRMKANTTAG